MIKLNSIKAILFDLGDTLISFKKSFPEREREIAKSISRMLLKFGYFVYDEDYYEKKTEEWEKWKKKYSVLGKEFEINEFFHSFLKKLNIEPKDILKLTPLLIDIIYKNDLRYVKLKPFVKTTLDKIRKMSFSMGIITNSSYSRNHILGILEYLRIYNYFNAVIASSQLKICKPNPKIFREALKILNVSPKQSIFVGNDFELDIKGAAKAGIRGILINSHDKNIRPEMTTNNFITVKRIDEVLCHL